mgnify:CR=1 FL=1
MDREISIGIPERKTLSDLWALSDKYYKIYGVEVENVSHWNPSEHFKDKLQKEIKLPSLNPIVDYVVSTNFPESIDIIKKIGFNDKYQYGLVTPTGSVSILSTISFLKEQGVQKIVVLAPVYWTVIHICRQFNIDIEIIYLERHEGNFSVPKNITKKSRSESEKIAYWFTNPVYCTGVHINNELIKLSETLVNNNSWIIFDECLSTISRSAGNQLRNYGKFIGIYAPHKGVCVNGIKFSIVITDKYYKEFLEHWSTVHYGCLGASNRIAALHFLSDDFDSYEKEFDSKISLTRDFLLDLSQHHTGLSIDQSANGYLNTLYFSNIKGDVSYDLDWLWNIVKESGAIMIPGTRNHFSPNLEFCFRVNLSADSPRFRSRLINLVNILSG